MKRNITLVLIVACLSASLLCPSGTVAGKRPVIPTPGTSALAGVRSLFYSVSSGQPLGGSWPIARGLRRGDQHLLPGPLPSNGYPRPSGLAGDSFPVSNYADPEGLAQRHSFPTVAYNALDGEYLAVWQGLTHTGEWYILAQRLTTEGTPLGTACVVSSISDIVADVSPLADVAYNVTADEYFVVWHDCRTGAEVLAYGQRVASDGVPIGDTLVIESGTADQGWPRVAANTASGEYLVIYNEYRAMTKWDVRGKRLDSQGQAIGDAFDIVAGEEEETFPALAYHGGRDEFLVIWEDARDYSPMTARDLYGQRLSAAGIPIADDFPVSDARADQLYPDVAYSTASRKYLVVWQDHRGGRGETDIWARTLSPLGALEGSEIMVCAETGSQMTPRVAYSTGSDGYLVVWQDERNGTGNGFAFAHRVSSDGELSGSAFALSTGGVNYQIRAVAVGSDLGGWMAAWQDGRNISGDEIHGQLIDGSGAILDADVAIAGASHGQERPDIACGSSVAGQMAVWMDYRNGTDYDIFGQQFGVDGSLVGDNIALLPRANSQGAPRIAYNSVESDYFVAAHSLESSDGFDVLGIHIGSDGSLLGGPFLLSESTATGDEGFPSIAYNSWHNEYLVAWHAFTQGSWNIHAQRIAADGSLQGDDLILCQAHHEQEFASVAYNPSFDEYAVVWQDRRDGTHFQVYLQLIGGDGTLLGGNIRVSEDALDNCLPEIIYDRDLQGYLVVWQYADQTTGSDIYARWLSGSGIPMGPGFAVCATPGDQAAPVAAYVPPAQEYLILWEEYRLEASASDIHGQRLSSEAGLKGSILTVSTEDNHQARPALPSLSETGRLTVIWQDYRNTNWDVYGQQVRLLVPSIYLPLLVKGLPAG